MNDYIQLINLLLSTLAFMLIAQWYIIPVLDRITKRKHFNGIIFLILLRPTNEQGTGEA